MLEDRGAAAQLDVRDPARAAAGKALGISEEAVRDEKHLRYIRGIDARGGGSAQGRGADRVPAQADVRRAGGGHSFGGGVMPQKSTDFYPKLLSGMAMYKLD